MTALIAYSRYSQGMRIVRLLLLVACPLLVAAAEKPEAMAAKSAESWLAIVDAGKYEESWNQASADFKKALTKEQWAAAVTDARTPLGKFEKRALEATQAIKDPPNAPAGEYVICQFRSDFQNKNGAVETVVMFLDGDKQWRTSGYFIK